MFVQSAASGPNPLELSKLQSVADADAARIKAYEEARQAYNGVFEDPVKTRIGDIRDLIKVNRVKPIVSATVNFLFGTPPSWELPASVDGEDAEQVKSEREAWLDDCLRTNNFTQLVLDLGINGAIYGTPYIGIDLSNNIPNPANPLKSFPRLHVLDPADMCMRWSPRDISTVTCYIWQYNTYDPDKRATMVVRRLVEMRADGWWITDQRSYSTNLLYGGDWITDGEVRWPFNWSPILHCKNLPCPNEVYGEPDVTPVIVALNKARNFNLSNWSRIVRKHAQPKPWVKGMMGKKIDLDGEVIDMPSDKAEIGQLTPVVDGASSETLGRVLDEAICEESQTPSLVLGRPDQAGIPSGTALKIKLWPLINKTETKRTLYGPMLVELFRRLLEAGGYGPNNVVTLQWPELVPTDPKEEREIIKMDLEIGVASLQTASQKLGYNFEAEQANRAASSKAVALGGTEAQTSPAATVAAPRSQAEIEADMRAKVQGYLQAEGRKIAAQVGQVGA